MEELNDERLDMIRQHIKSKWGPDAVCPMCRKADWVITMAVCHLPMHYLYFPRDETKEQLNDFLKQYPTGMIQGRYDYAITPVTCRQCGFVAFLSAAQIGLTPAPYDDEMV